MLSNRFFQKFSEMCKRVGVPARDLLLVIYIESKGGKPDAVNPNGGAAGLIQFMPPTLRGLGLNKSEVANFKNKSAEEQLPYIEQYIRGKNSIMKGKPFTSATQYYIANLWPIALDRWHGTDPTENANMVVINSRSKRPDERGAYLSNKGLDVNGNGVITAGDLTKYLMGVEQSSGFQQMLSKFNVVDGPGVVTERSLGLASEKNMLASNQKKKRRSNPGLLSIFLKKIENLVDHYLGSTASLKSNKITALGYRKAYLKLIKENNGK